MTDNRIDILISQKILRNIYTIRGKQVMMDSDLAELYNVETKVFNQSVKRNIERFPGRFRFKLQKREFESLKNQFENLNMNQNLRSQNVTSSLSDHGGRRYLPYVFTEQGVSMLSAVLRSEKAVKVSIQIMDAFVNMRKFMNTNAGVFQRLNKLEEKQLMMALRLDDYVDETVLTLLSKRDKNCKATIYSRVISKELELDLKKHNDQYEPIQIREFKKSHDRFIILDNKYIYHLGASLKDLGKKWFAFPCLKKILWIF